MLRTKADLLEEVENLTTILRALRRRRAVLEEQAATEGTQVRPSVVIEIKDLNQQLIDREQELAQLEALIQDVAAWGTPVVTLALPRELTYSLTVSVPQERLEQLFANYATGEIYYRLEQLYLLGFLDKQRVHDDDQGRERYMYRLSAAYTQARR